MGTEQHKVRSIWSAGASSRFLTFRTARKRRRAAALQTLRAVEVENKKESADDSKALRLCVLGALGAILGSDDMPHARRHKQ